MNINFGNKKPNRLKHKKLFESDTLQDNTVVIKQNTGQNQKVDQQKLQTVMAVKSKQFVFDCGAIMGAIKYDIGTKFGLKWHVNNTSSEDEFIESVRKFIEITGETMSENDENRLRNEYKKV